VPGDASGVRGTTNRRGQMRRILGALVTSLALFVAASVAHANRSIEMSASSLTVSGPLTILDRSGTVFRIECQITKITTLNRRIPKNAGAVIGGVTSLSARSCRNGNITFLREAFPWTIAYAGYGGALPRITSLFIELRSVAFLIETPLMRCLYSGNGGASLGGLVIEELLLNVTVDIPLISQLRGGLMECPREATLTGTLEAINEVTMRLA
jgi:hypothetical protein